MNQSQSVQPFEQAPKKASALKWLLLVLALIILGGVGYYFIKNYVQTSNRPALVKSPSSSTSNSSVGKMTTLQVNGETSYQVTIPKSYTVLGNNNSLLLLTDPSDGLQSADGIAISIQPKEPGAFDKSIEDCKTKYVDKGKGTYNVEPTRTSNEKTIRQATCSFDVTNTASGLVIEKNTNIYNEIKIADIYYWARLSFHQDMNLSKKEQYINAYQSIINSITL